MTGAFGLLLYFNGVSWYNFQNITLINGAYGSSAIKDNIIAVVGLTEGEAIITIGRR
jgi:hypothetical protein